MKIKGQFNKNELVVVDGKIMSVVRSDFDDGSMSDGEDTGWYSEVTEPTEAQMQTARYMTMYSQIQRDREYEARQQQIIEDRRNADLAKWEQERQTPEYQAEKKRLEEESDIDLDLFNELFAGTSDN